MFITTKGVVLKSYPFKQKKIIIKVFTRDHGLLTFMTRKTKSQSLISQPLTVIEVTYKNPRNSSISYIKDVGVEDAYHNLLFNNKKLQIAISLSEILQKCLKEPSSKIYDFIVTSFKWLDTTNDYYIGFESLFLVHFCAISGISPTDNLILKKSSVLQLDLQAGAFIQNDIELKYETLAPHKVSVEIYKLTSLNFEQLSEQKMEEGLSKQIFEHLISYISIHLTDLSGLKSIRLLKELF